MIKYFLTGFGTKIVTGFDDTLTHIPLISYLTKTRKGKFAFSLGIFLAVCLAVGFAVGFSYLLTSIPYYRYLVGGFIFVLAIAIYFEIFQKGREKKTERKIQKVKCFTRKRFFKLMAIGFVAALATVIDDTLAYSSILTHSSRAYSVAGILSATILEIFFVIRFSKHLNKFKYKKEIASGGLLILSVLIFLGVV